MPRLLLRLRVPEQRPQPHQHSRPCHCGRPRGARRDRSGLHPVQRKLSLVPRPTRAGTGHHRDGGPGPRRPRVRRREPEIRPQLQRERHRAERFPGLPSSLRWPRDSSILLDPARNVVVRDRARGCLAGRPRRARDHHRPCCCPPNL
ncbi:hypothetical protein ACFPRL_25495 [Pseudoclavibacter helvolus]